MFKPFDNKLTAAEIERLAILSEELGERSKLSGKSCVTDTVPSIPPKAI